MKKGNLEIIKLTAREILLSLLDLATPFFEASPLYQKSTQEYLAEREIDRAKFWARIQYLRKKGYIKTFIKNKKSYCEITPRGKKYAKFILLKNIKINRPKRWDGKWRVVIFDIPEKLRFGRDVLRDKLKDMDFIQIQKSVYIYPFECAQEIAFLSKALKIEKYVAIMISEIIQGEEKIINKFFKKEILNKNDLKIKNKTIQMVRSYQKL